MTAPLLSVDGVTGGYGDVQVLWGVDLQIKVGQVVSLIGSNGAGKSTLLRTISGLLPTSGGCIACLGEDITDAAPEKIVSSGVIHVPEGRRLFAGMTVRENLMMGAYHRRDGTQAIRNDLELVFGIFPRLRERRHQDAVTLSGGEQQMCAIARGIMAAPKLLMIDELSLGLAPRLVDELGEALLAINERGLAILLVEQDVMTALNLADEAYVMDTGRITRRGSSETLASDPYIKEAYLGVTPSTNE